MTETSGNPTIPIHSVFLSIDGKSGDKKLEQAMAETMLDLFNLFKEKQASYGPKNIATFGERGCVIRANDKIQRLIRLVWDGEQNPLKDETISDTWFDLADYALIAILCRMGAWPGGTDGKE